jgi:hypothetical protein
MDNCPVCTIYPAINVGNHIQCIEMANLGPADPREPSNEFWAAKAKVWKITEGEARTHLCMNCEEYNDSPENMDCVSKGPGAKVKASELPVKPKWADIQGMPAAVCDRWSITCSALRTCDDWEPDSEDMMD